MFIICAFVVTTLRITMDGGEVTYGVYININRVYIYIEKFVKIKQTWCSRCGVYLHLPAVPPTKKLNNFFVP